MTKNNHTTAICAGARHRLCCCSPWNCFQPRTPDALLAHSSLKHQRKYKSEKGDKYCRSAQRNTVSTLLQSAIKLIRFNPPFVILALYISRQRWMVEEQRRSVVFPLRLLGLKRISCCDQSTRCSNINTIYQSDPGGQDLAGAKMAMKPFVKRVFTIFATNASFLRIISNIRI